MKNRRMKDSGISFVFYFLTGQNLLLSCTFQTSFSPAYWFIGGICKWHTENCKNLRYWYSRPRLKTCKNQEKVEMHPEEWSQVRGGHRGVCAGKRGSQMTKSQIILALMQRYSVHLPGSIKQKRLPISLLQFPGYNWITHGHPLFQAHRTKLTSINPSVLVLIQRAKKDDHTPEWTSVCAYLATGS